jgi:acyl carrier protein
MSDINARLQHIVTMMGITYNRDQTWEQMGLDSLDEISLVMEIEEEFNIEIPDGKAAEIKNPEQAIEYLKQRGILL